MASSDVSPAVARRLDDFVSELLDTLQDPGSYNWEGIREGILQIYLDASMRRAGL